MSKSSSAAFKSVKSRASLFAALGDPTRLSLVGKLVDGQTHSISSLSAGSKITRQAVTKHLHVLENVGLVTKVSRGRESLYALDPRPLKALKESLDIISQQWDQTLQNLKTFVESESL